MRSKEPQVKMVSHAILRGMGDTDSPLYFFLKPSGSEKVDLISSPFAYEWPHRHLADHLTALGLKAHLASVPTVLHREVLRADTGPVDLTRLYFRADIAVAAIPPEIAVQMISLTAFQVACLPDERLRREMIRWLVMVDAGLKLPESAGIVRFFESGSNSVQQAGNGANSSRVRGSRMLVLQTCRDPALRHWMSQHPLVVQGRPTLYQPNTVNR